MSKQASAHVPTVMLALDKARVASRGFLRGIAQYAHLYGPWKFVSPPPVYRRTQKELPEQLKNVDGRITYVLDSKQASHFRQQSIPTIAIRGLDVITRQRIAYVRDGEVIYDVHDPGPYTDGWFGFRTVNNHMTIDNFKVYRLKK